jgi:hypothetical protein
MGGQQITTIITASPNGSERFVGNPEVGRKR